MLSLVVMKTHRLEPLLNPDSIAIVGASNNAARIGGMPPYGCFLMPFHAL